MWFAHNSNNSNSTSSTNRLCFEQGCKLIFIVFRDSANDLDKLGSFRYFILTSGFMDERVKIDFASLVVVLDELSDDFRDIF